MNWEGLGLGGRGSEVSGEKQFDDLAPDWERSSGYWYEGLLISGLEWPAPGGSQPQDKAGAMRNADKVLWHSGRDPEPSNCVVYSESQPTQETPHNTMPRP